MTHFALLSASLQALQLMLVRWCVHVQPTALQHLHVADAQCWLSAAYGVVLS